MGMMTAAAAKGEATAKKIFHEKGFFFFASCRFSCSKRIAEALSWMSCSLISLAVSIGGNLLSQFFHRFVVLPLDGPQGFAEVTSDFFEGHLFVRVEEDNRRLFLIEEPLDR